jgi:hypothetical protein
MTGFVPMNKSLHIFLVTAAAAAVPVFWAETRAIRRKLIARALFGAGRATRVVISRFRQVLKAQPFRLP